MVSCRELLNGRTASYSVKYNIVEVLLTYTCVMRLFNGDLFDSPTEVAEVMYSLSNVLAEDRVYSDVETLFVLYTQNHEQNTFIGVSIGLFEECVEDLKCFFNRTEMIVTNALCDFHSKVKKIKKLLKGTEMSKKLYKTVKKLYFFSIYCNENEAVVRETAKHLIDLYDQKRMEDGVFKDQMKDIEKHRQKLQPNMEVKLIEEVS